MKRAGAKKYFAVSVVTVVGLLFHWGLGRNKSSQKRSADADLREYWPEVHRSEDKAVISWAGIKRRIARTRGINLNNVTASIFIDGIEVIKNLPWSIDRQVLVEAPGKQTDYYVVFKLDHETLDISEFNLKEALGSNSSQNVSSQTFTGEVSGEGFRIFLPDHLKQMGMSERLTERSVTLGYKKVVWVLSPEARSEVRAFIDKANGATQVRPVFDRAGKVQSVVLKYGDLTMNARSEDFFFKVDAAFNGNAFFWDDMAVALATVPYHPWLAESTIHFWLMVQKLNGGVIPREVRKENLLSLWFSKTIRAGKEPRPNLTYTNPYLMSWPMDTLYRYNPSKENLSLLEKVSDSIDSYATWMEQNRAVHDRSGRIIGFNGSALGSGMDNSRGRVGNLGEEAAYNTCFVDFISQHIAMLKDQSRWNSILANSSDIPKKQKYLEISQKAQVKADMFSQILNELYWSESDHFYYDLIPTADGQHRQDSRYRSIAGFWPLFAAAVPKDRLDHFVQKQMRKEAFGGNFPFPANAREMINFDGPKEYAARPLGQEDGYWDQGAHWPIMAMVATEGFSRSGRPDLAYTYSRDYLLQMASSGDHTVEEAYGEVPEMDANGELGFRARPLQHARHVHRKDFAGWGKGPATDMQINHILGLRPDDNGILQWGLRNELLDGESFRLQQLNARGGPVEHLMLTRLSQNHYLLNIKTDHAFSLELSSFVDENGKLSSLRQASAPALNIPGAPAEQVFEVTLLRSALPEILNR